MTHTVHPSTETISNLDPILTNLHHRVGLLITPLFWTMGLSPCIPGFSPRELFNRYRHRLESYARSLRKIPRTYPEPCVGTFPSLCRALRETTLKYFHNLCRILCENASNQHQKRFGVLHENTSKYSRDLSRILCENASRTVTLSDVDISSTKTYYRTLTREASSYAIAPPSSMLSLTTLYCIWQ